MVNYLLGALGIVVSVALFLIGYRQTIGARKERVGSANADLQRILLRRVILEGFAPTREDIERLRDGKSRESRVAISDILLPVQLMNSVYTQVVENDFISPELRKGIMAAINPVAERLIKTEELEPEPPGRDYARSALPVLLGVVTTTLGAAVAVLPQFRSIALGRKDTLELVVTIVVASLTIIVSYLLFTRLRDQQDESQPSRSGPKAGFEFEASVLHALKKMGLCVRRPPVQSGYDFQVTTAAGSKILVETKAWPPMVPPTMVRRVVERLSDLVAKEEAKEALLVLRQPLVGSPNFGSDTPVKIFSLNDMRRYLAQ